MNSTYLNTEQLETIFNQITKDPDYKSGIKWGEPRPGHPESTIEAHIEELEENLRKCWKNGWLNRTEHWKLRILIHVHDTFKGQAKPRSSIEDSYSHASLATKFLSQFCDDKDMLNMVQYHDESFALYRQFKKSGQCNQDRLNKLIDKIENWRLFILFNIIDSYTKGKETEPMIWFVNEMSTRVETDIDESFVTLKETHPSNVPPGM